MRSENAKSKSDTDVIIIGAGPYGLSLAAHLAGRGVDFRIFGKPMGVWSEQMPIGMQLKSEGFASSLSDPKSEFLLRDYCRQQALPYADTGLPVPLETFVSYGLAFQKKFVPNLEEKLVVSVVQSSVGFDVELDDGERVSARKIVIAVGITHYSHVPVMLSAMPEGLVSHSSEHRDLEGFRGRKIVVVGAGASALDLAALLHQAGASVQLIARSSQVRFHDPPRPRSLRERLFRPTTGIGGGIQLLFYANVPHLFRYLPEDVRLIRVRKTLGPAPGWFVRDQVVGKVPLHLGCEITDAKAENGRARLHITDGKSPQIIEADHVIAATGYQVDLGRLRFMSQKILEKIRVTGTSPSLSAMFESSVPGLYFVGVSAANSFGPLMRFAYGAGFTAPRLARHLSKMAHRQSGALQESGEVQVLKRS